MAGKKNMRVAVLAAGAAAAGAAAAATCALRRRDPHPLRGGGLVYTTRGSQGEPVRVLRRGGVFQSATYLGEKCLEPVFEYYRAFGDVLGRAPEARRVLVVGGGGCSFPKLVALERPCARVDVVEIDPCVVDAARRWFYVDEAARRMRDNGGDLQLVCADGRAFLDAAPTASYDMIALDAFSGAAPVAANVVTPAGDATFLRDLYCAFEAVFGRVELLPCEDAAWGADDNYLMAAWR